jgi:predicted PP-loop superfamily ATPase
MSKVNGFLVSEWSNGTVKTTCSLEIETGELNPEVADVSNEFTSLENEYFETLDGEQIPVCRTCHEFIMKTVMNPGLGHTLTEDMECSNPDCESRTEE